MVVERLNGRQMGRPPPVARRTRFVLLDYYGTNQSAASRRKLARFLFLSLVRIYVTGGIEKLKEGKTPEDAGLAQSAICSFHTGSRVICACERENNLFSAAASACVGCVDTSHSRTGGNREIYLY